MKQLFDKMKKRRTVIYVDVMTVFIAVLENHKIIKATSFLMHETPTDLLRKQVQEFAGAAQSDVLAIVPRSYILQKDFVLAGASTSAIKEELDLKLHAMLPFSVKDMAWGLWLGPKNDTSEGVLIAAPEQKIRKTLSFLNDLGFQNQNIEIISEDQTLLWILAVQKNKDMVLFLQRNETRLLAVFVHGDRLIFSQTLDLSDTAIPAHDLYTELSLKLVEIGTQPQKIILDGQWSPEQRLTLNEHFKIPLENFSESTDASISGMSSIFFGASFYSRYPMISLLPKEEKMAKRVAVRKGLIRDISFIAVFLVILFSMIQWGQLANLNRQKKVLESKIELIQPDAAEAKKALKAMALVEDARRSQNNLAGLLKDIAVTVPATVRVNEIRIEGDKVLFSGQSPSYNAVSETVAALEQNPFIKDVQLQGTRLKRQGADKTLEFEVRGLWYL